MDTFWWILLIIVVAVIWLGFSIVRGGFRLTKRGVKKVKDRRDERRKNQ